MSDMADDDRLQLGVWPGARRARVTIPRPLAWPATKIPNNHGIQLSEWVGERRCCQVMSGCRIHELLHRCIVGRSWRWWGQKVENQGNNFFGVRRVGWATVANPSYRTIVTVHIRTPQAAQPRGKVSKNLKAGKWYAGWDGCPAPGWTSLDDPCPPLAQTDISVDRSRPHLLSSTFRDNQFQPSANAKHSCLQKPTEHSLRS